jgi:hypothetical protein
VSTESLSTPVLSQLPSASALSFGMPDRPDNLPSKIDRAAVDRVLARAVQLQSESSNEPQGQLSESQLLDLAKEVGLDPVNLRQALAEERTRVALPEEHGMLASLYGGSLASAQRVVRGTPAHGATSSARSAGR